MLHANNMVHLSIILCYFCTEVINGETTVHCQEWKGGRLNVKLKAVIKQKGMD